MVVLELKFTVVMTLLCSAMGLRDNVLTVSVFVCVGHQTLVSTSVNKRP